MNILASIKGYFVSDKIEHCFKVVAVNSYSASEAVRLRLENRRDFIFYKWTIVRAVVSGTYRGLTSLEIQNNYQVYNVTFSSDQKYYRPTVREQILNRYKK